MKKINIVFLFVTMISIFGCAGSGSSSTMPPTSVQSISPPVITLSLSKPVVNLGASSTVVWSSMYSSTCIASGAWSGTQAIAGVSEQTPTNLGANTYTLTCNGEGGASIQSIVLNALTPVTEIKLNQLGYKPSSEKIAIVPAVAATRFNIVETNSNIVVYSADLSEEATWEPSLEIVKIANFSALKTHGDYELRINGVTDSGRFRISSDVYVALIAA
nr:cellulase N-terminal Ig-like domain-containing protein [uncultured Undibacterium sp.]